MSVVLPASPDRDGLLAQLDITMHHIDAALDAGDRLRFRALCDRRDDILRQLDEPM